MSKKVVRYGYIDGDEYKNAKDFMDLIQELIESEINERGGREKPQPVKVTVELISKIPTRKKG